MADKTVASLTSSTPTIDDLTISYDNADTSELKKTTWQLVRDLFKTYFDTIYQAVLVSGTNIKTVNGNTLLGSGDIVISGAVSDGDKGDITVTGSGATWTIDDATVTPAKINATGTPSATTFFRGDGTWSTPSGSGTVTNTGGNLTANAVVLGAGTTDTKVVTGITTDGTSVLNLGVNATTIGKVKMFGNTSGDVTIQPSAIAGTATVLTLPATTGTVTALGNTTTGTGSTIVLSGSPALTTPSIAAITVSGGTLTLPTGASDTLVSKNSTDTLTNKTLTSPALVTPSLGVATATSINGATITSGTLNGSVTGTNTGDQTTIVGITGTKAQFDTACTDDNFMYVGTVQNITAAKNFFPSTFGMVNVASTIISFFSNTATIARTWTFPDKNGTVAMTSDITGTNSGTNTGDETTGRINTLYGTSNAFTAGSIELGHATDTTISRVSAGVIAVEGVNQGTEGILQNSQSAAYTLVLTDAGKHIYHPSADTTARIWTIPANGSVAFPIGTAVTFVNDTSAGTITISITTDTLVLAGAGTTGSRTLTANGVATAIKVTSTRWIISGTSNLT